MMFKFNICEVPKAISDLFMVNYFSHNHILETLENNFHTPLGRNEVSYCTFSYIGTHIWNHMSQNVSINVSYSKFKFFNKILYSK